jgi:hypothetical protein
VGGRPRGRAGTLRKLASGPDKLCAALRPGVSDKTPDSKTPRPSSPAPPKKDQPGRRRPRPRRTDAMIRTAEGRGTKRSYT